MPEKPNAIDKMKYIQLVLLPRWFPFKNYDGGEISVQMHIEIQDLFERFTDPKKMDEFEDTRLRELERLKKKDWKECKVCQKLREPEHFVSCYKTCLLCLDMTPEEAINAATLNGAYAMGVSATHGSITKGKRANIIITKPISSYYQLPYSFGTNLIEKIII
jgi:hypothetical protein